MTYEQNIKSIKKTFVWKRNSETQTAHFISRLPTETQTSIVVLCGAGGGWWWWWCYWESTHFCKLFCTYGKSHYRTLEFKEAARAFAHFNRIIQRLITSGQTVLKDKHMEKKSADVPVRQTAGQNTAHYIQECFLLKLVTRNIILKWIREPNLCYCTILFKVKHRV